MTLAEAVADLVRANRILHSQGVVDGFGHVSMRHPEFHDRFLLSRNLAPAQVEMDDILEFGSDGEPMEPAHPPIYLERFIHAALYRARPDVGAVVHSHSRSVIPFGAVDGLCLKPVSHMAGFLGKGAPCFEIRKTAGAASDMLIRDNMLGDALAESLGAAPVVLMRGHGATAVGRTVQEAVFHAVYTEWNAAILAQTMSLGAPILMNSHEAAAAAESNAGQIGRAWDYWNMQAERER